jgi:flagellar protein FliJ
VKRYQFSLKRVLKVRKIEEEIAHNLLIQARNRARDTENQLSNLELMQINLYEVLREEELPLEKNIQCRSYLNFNRQKISNIEERLLSQKNEVTRQREDYLNRRKKKEALEKLQERGSRDYYKKLMQKEQKDLDEIGQRLWSGVSLR